MVVVHVAGCVALFSPKLQCGDFLMHTWLSFPHSCQRVCAGVTSLCRVCISVSNAGAALPDCAQGY